ncbi:MAG: Re/Si-specific NAD(P)(+) transhydrogenase subunit alpha [Alphaproteobacteria bacterium]|nr:Re/Si-specific NAD(P)(+) transhydrogenase subunit alpha [Alphaproteobacteria bacterium]
MKLGIPKEVRPGERRVAGTPDTVRRLKKMGFEVRIQSGAGVGARFSDDAYREAGAEVVDSADPIWGESDVILKVRPPQEVPDTDVHEADLLREGVVLISLLFPAQNTELIERIAARKATAIALDAVPRISRAQKMDVLSSMANIAGYRAVIEAANQFGGFFTGQITAAGKTPPAKVLIIGAGVAGLAAIGAARGLGAVVRAFDVRPAVKEQVQSLGATFLELEFEESGEGEGGYAKTMSKEFIDAEMALFRQQCAEVDVIITTALVPGKRAPVLITEDMVETLRDGSVIVDLAAEQGGNCALTEPDQVVERHGVTIIGYTDLTSRLATHASQFFSTNICHLLDDMGGATDFRIDHEDDAVRGALVLEDGALMWPPPKPKVAPPKPAPAAPEPVVAHTPALPVKASSNLGTGIASVVGAAALAFIGVYAPMDFIQHFTVFVLACFIGWQVIWNVSPALHTPLMSVTNAISGIIIVGGMLQAGSGDYNLAAILGAVAIGVAAINVVGGFMVTQRMLRMFRLDTEA